MVAQLMTLMPLTDAQTDAIAAATRERAALETEYPGRADFVPVYAEFDRCIRHDTEVAPTGAVRKVLTDDLSAADVAELLAFYQGPDYARMVQLETSGQKPTDAERARFETLMKTSAISRFYAGIMDRAEKQALSSEPRPADRDCAGERGRALAALGLFPTTSTGSGQ